MYNLTPRILQHPETGGDSTVAAGTANEGSSVFEALGYHQVSGGSASVEAAAEVEAAAVELEVALIEPDIVQVALYPPHPGPGQALLLVLHHVDGGGWQEVG